MLEQNRRSPLDVGLLKKKLSNGSSNQLRVSECSTNNFTRWVPNIMFESNYANRCRPRIRTNIYKRTNILLKLRLFRKEDLVELTPCPGVFGHPSSGYSRSVRRFWHTCLFIFSAHLQIQHQVTQWQVTRSRQVTSPQKKVWMLVIAIPNGQSP